MTVKTHVDTFARDRLPANRAATNMHKVPAAIAGARASMGDAAGPIACSHSE